MQEIENSNDILSKDLAVIEFFTVWCGPCKIQKGILEEISKENPQIFFGMVDVEKFYKLAEEFKIKNVPTIIYFVKGQEKGRFLGLQQKEKVKNLISQTNVI